MFITWACLWEKRVPKGLDDGRRGQSHGVFIEFYIFLDCNKERDKGD